MAFSQRILTLAALCGLVCGQAVIAQTGLTTIQDTLFKADGTRFNGTLTIHWTTFDTASLGTIVQQSTSVQVVNGNLLVQLAPNATGPAQANVYTVQYQSDGREQFTETWTVPASVQPLKVSSVRTGSAINSGGGTAGNQTPLAESSVIGLVADLAQRPTKGVGYGTNRVAVVDDTGSIQTAVGSPGDCVYVDGTAGPCGQATLFADAETPAGIVDGVNNALALSNVPVASSVMLFRNGLYMTPGFDYTVNGSSLQFLPGAIPQAGDTITASYRIDPSASSIGGIADPAGAVRAAVAQVICSAAGTTTGAASSVSLGGCSLPAAALKPGDRIEVRFTFAHTGTSAGYDLQVNWGGTTVLARHAAAQDAAVTGRAEAAIVATGAQLSVESWGSLLPFLPGIVNAPTQAGLRIDFRAACSQPTVDAVTLTNFTVLRYPRN